MVRLEDEVDAVLAELRDWATALIGTPPGTMVSSSGVGRDLLIHTERVSAGLDAVRRKAADDRAEQIAQAIEKRRLARRRRWLRSHRWSGRDEAVWSQAMWDAVRITRNVHSIERHER